ncbi:glycosyltransferase family 2 protein [Rhodoferax sp. UBA5149]|uniref:glycosyltransferase family 2 protein n=1 Tax=Rhodoferax sp. UBA5149 TaxID=1947379 RepID=UPI0025E35FD2|nr:glycosyltransferase family 2 protein [Rhodoferax sp. UBA5149]
MNSSSTIRNNPLISVVVPIHNGAQWLGQTLDSLFAQSCPNFEIVLIDDASTDSLPEVLASFHDTRLHVVHLKKNVGVSAARNIGIELAKGRFIAFCDADDLCKQERFEKQVAYLEHNAGIGICGSAFTCFDEEVRQTVQHPGSDQEIKTALMRGNCFGLSTVMGRAEIFKHHRFDEVLSVAEDYDLWTRLSHVGVRFANLPESLLLYRWHPQQASRYKSDVLDHVTRKIRSVYCAELLGDSQLLDRIKSAAINQNDLDNAAQIIEGYAALHPETTAQLFRFMLAWLYQRLPYHGIGEWLHWQSIQTRLDLKLDWNYRLNTALLAFLPDRIGQKHFDTLIKLKR